jgi:hypothetical protein
MSTQVVLLVFSVAASSLLVVNSAFAESLTAYKSLYCTSQVSSTAGEDADVLGPWEVKVLPNAGIPDWTPQKQDVFSIQVVAFQSGMSPSEVKVRIVDEKNRAVEQIYGGPFLGKAKDEPRNASFNLSVTHPTRDKKIELKCGADFKPVFDKSGPPQIPRR